MSEQSFLEETLSDDTRVMDTDWKTLREDYDAMDDNYTEKQWYKTRPEKDDLSRELLKKLRDKQKNTPNEPLAVDPDKFAFKLNGE